MDIATRRKLILTMISRRIHVPISLLPQFIDMPEEAEELIHQMVYENENS